MVTRDEVRSWTDRTINTWISKEIGWHYGLELYPALPEHLPFVDNFNRLFATKARDGFDGPLAWLRAHGAGERFLYEVTREAGWFGTLFDASEKGPRALAEVCVVAMSHVKSEETLGEETER